MSTPANSQSAAGAQRKPNTFTEIIVTIVVPAVVLMQLSREERLGPLYALILALAFPVAWGLYDALKWRKFNFFAVLGIVSTLLTGGIGLLKIDTYWLAWKEALVPGLIGLAVLGSTFTRWPLIRTLVFNEQVMDVQRIEAQLKARQTQRAFEQRLLHGTWMLAGTFAFSAVVNFFLARWVVTSATGTEAFNEELGRLTLLSYPVIALPSMLMMMGVFWYLAHHAKALTGLTITQMLRADAPPAEAKAGAAAQPGPDQKT
jgi:intracellular septation protein A